MVFKRCLFFSVIMVFMFLFTYTAHPASKFEIESLRGLTGVCVLVEDLQNEIKKELPFDENQIRVDAELKLRMAGIKVLSKEEHRQTPGTPYLYINLSIDQMSNKPILFLNINIQFEQMVYLERNPTISLLGTTWSTGVIGAIGKHRASAIRDKIKDLLDTFINDYLSVNPKEQK